MIMFRWKLGNKPKSLTLKVNNVKRVQHIVTYYHVSFRERECTFGKCRCVSAVYSVKGILTSANDVNDNVSVITDFFKYRLYRQFRGVNVQY